ncbi:MAG: hypothetical protein HXY28_13775 [Hydrogenophilaceae bacterium]|jgi:hypothetical protein|nr:hypothetical protein [Hydrogenophilaceae bacterium]
MSSTRDGDKTVGIGVLPLGVALAVTLLAAYAVCWLVAASPYSSPFAHAWLDLFSAAPQGSTAQLIEGGVYSVVAAWFAALIFTPVYNIVARADRLI